MSQDDARIRSADGARAGHILALADDERGSAQQACEDRRVDDRDRDRRARRMRAEHGDDADRQQHHREGEEHVHEAHDDAVEPAAVVGGEKTERAAGDERDADRERAGGKRRAVAVEDAREHVAAELVGAEPVKRARPSQAPRHALRHRIVRRKPGRCDRDQRSAAITNAAAKARRRLLRQERHCSGPHPRIDDADRGSRRGN